MTSGLVFFAFLIGCTLILGAHALTEMWFPEVMGNRRPSERPSGRPPFERVFRAAQYDLFVLAACTILLLQTVGWSDGTKGLLVIGTAIASAGIHAVMTQRTLKRWRAFSAEVEARSGMTEEEVAARGRLESGLARIGFGSVMPSLAFYRLLEAIQALAAKQGAADIEEACAQKMTEVSVALGQPLQVRAHDEGE